MSRLMPFNTFSTPSPEGNSLVTFFSVARISFCSPRSTMSPFSSMVMAARAAMRSQSWSSSSSYRLPSFLLTIWTQPITS